jgi:hypothetical protein
LSITIPLEERCLEELGTVLRDRALRHGQKTGRRAVAIASRVSGVESVLTPQMNEEEEPASRANAPTQLPT